MATYVLQWGNRTDERPLILCIPRHYLGILNILGIPTSKAWPTEEIHNPVMEEQFATTCLFQVPSASRNLGYLST